MTKQEQINFIQELCNNGVASLVGLVEEGKIPENWDGIELRWLIAEKFSNCATKKNNSNKRERDYNNVVIVNNL